MEVAAGFAEHVDVQVGRLVDELDRLGYAENTLFLYIWGDNGSSGEGQNGTIVVGHWKENAKLRVMAPPRLASHRVPLEYQHRPCCGIPSIAASSANCWDQ